MLRYIQGDDQGMREVRERAEAVSTCPEDCLLDLECLTTFARRLNRHDWAAMLEEQDSRCVRELRAGGLPCRVTHLAACIQGRWELAADLEALVEESVAGDLGAVVPIGGCPGATLCTMEGVRLALAGDLPLAESRFREGHDRLRFGSADEGLRKIENMLYLAEVLQAMGRSGEAARLEREALTLNPPMVDRLTRTGRGLLGLRAGS